MAQVYKNPSVSVTADELHIGSERIKLKSLNGLVNGTSHSMHHSTNGHVFVNGDSHPQAQAGALLDDQVPSLPKTEPIAIVGMGCRLPGEASTPSKLWDLLRDGRSGRCDVPASRFNMKGFYHPNPDRPGTMNTKGGYFIREDIRAFENSFFGINNLEATYMDPQQRKLLEVVYECFENAGKPLHQVSGANVGCYVGNFTTDYQQMQFRDPEYMHRYSATGIGPTILANRISHVFNLTGPSSVLDTACSSSLYCLHSACVALEAGECDSAIVAGANLIQSPQLHLGVVKAGILSGTSTCHTFDTSADGYGRAEGVGALFVKRLSDAIRDGDPVRAVIRGTAVNSNGKTNGITLPSADGQESVIRKAYEKAGLPLDATDYIEAHGTGTAVGDPIEVDALSRVLNHRSGRPTLVGSVKTNLGHSEAVSGITSIMKVALALEKGVIPPTIGLDNVNPDLKLDERNVSVVTKVTPWPSVAIPRASVNSFGYGGANAHAILEAASAHLPEGYRIPAPMPTARTKFLLPFSANSETALNRRVSDLAEQEMNGDNLLDLAYTMACRRSLLPIRGYLLASRKTYEDNLKPDQMRTLPSTSKPCTLPYAFVFTGQGAQWPEMGRQLMEEFPTYRRAIQDLDSYLANTPHPPTWTLQGAIADPADNSKINLASHSQPVCTATQIALVELLREWDICPEAVIGHSSGEIAAAYVAGHLTAREAIIIAYYRGLVVSKSAAEGAMMAVGLSQDAAKEEISNSNLEGRVRVACVNSPESSTISGDLEAIDDMLASLQERQVFARRLKTDGRAYHSHHMVSLGQEYEQLVSNAMVRQLGNKSGSYSHSTVRMVSSVTGQEVGRASASTPSYWRSNLESPVMFSDALEKLLEGHQYHLIEVGPHSALELPIKQTWAALKQTETPLLYSTAMTRGKDALDTMLNLVGSLFLQGHEMDFASVNRVGSDSTQKPDVVREGKVLHDLPRYAWQYDQELWREPRISEEYRNRRYPRHDVLGSYVPGGNGSTHQWRNILKIKDISWLVDHKLDKTVVFPAAGYIAMAVEAACQLSGTLPQRPTVKLRRMNIFKALMLTSQEGGLELHTELRRDNVTETINSSRWWSFEISSYADGATTSHASGLVCLNETAKVPPTNVHVAMDSLEQGATRTWYDKLIKEGLNYGPNFQCLREIAIDRARHLQHSLAKTLPLYGGGEGLGQESEYFIHPTTVDGMLQAGIIAGTGGSSKDLVAKVPVFIEEARITLSKDMHKPSELWDIRSIAKTVGFGTEKFDTDLCDPETNSAYVSLRGVRILTYQGASQEDSANTPPRYPMLRILWKPDVSNIFTGADNEAFTHYVDSYSNGTLTAPAASDHRRLAGALDLLVHENPALRILDLGDDDVLTTFLLTSLHMDTPFKRCLCYYKGSLTETGGLTAEELGARTNLPASKDSLYDVVILPSPSTTDIYLGQRLKDTNSLLAPKASLLLASVPSTVLPLDKSNVKLVETMPTDHQKTITLARLNATGTSGTHVSRKSGVILVTGSQTHELDKQLQSTLSTQFEVNVPMIPLAKVSPSTIPERCTVILTVDLDHAVLTSLNGEEMSYIKTITDSASYIVWVTQGNFYKSARPDYAVVLGLARALRLEQPSLQITVFDIDDVSTGHEKTASNILQVMHHTVDDAVEDYEYTQHQGVVQTSRFIPEDVMNAKFREKVNRDAIEMPLEDAGLCQLSIRNPGQLGSLHFAQQISNDMPLKPDWLEVQVKCVGLNAKDLYVFGAKVDTRNSTCSLEHSGIVTKVGEDVKDFAPGDLVVAMAPGKFSTFERVPQWACHKLSPTTDLSVSSTIPIVFSTALYALHHRAQIQPGESVLIHSAAGGFGLAAIQIAKLAGAQIFATVGTDEKRDFLVNSHGIEPDCIFNSRDTEFLPQIMKKTEDRGVDVVLNSLTGELLHASWKACADFGRFVEIGKRDILDGGRLEMQYFSRNVTFTAFDLSDLYASKSAIQNRIWSKLLKESMSLLEAGKIQPIAPLRTFDVSNIVDAFRHLSSGTRMGKIAVSLADPKTNITVLPFKHIAVLSPDKTYLMVGCLGGIGRSLSKWMMQRGARKFCFLGRSGTDKEPARRLVEDLRAIGATIEVVRGDVSSLEAVQEAVKVSNDMAPIGGVIQAAMGLSEALWTSMSNKAWHTAIVPKVAGTWHLHNSLAAEKRDANLDFFLITSSIAGSVGTATESNYCAANAFLDAFARHRRSLGLPCTSIGLGMVKEVGYLHEHPEIEAILTRKGIHAINEEDLLQVVDIALTTPAESLQAGQAHFAEGHLLTGLEVVGMNAIRRRGFEGGNKHVLDDPRAAVVAGALAVSTSGDPASEGQSESGLPSNIATAISAGDKPATITAAQGIIAQKLSNLILLPVEKLTKDSKLSDFGMDSMLAAEYRTYIFQSLKVDVPFLTLLAKGTTLGSLAEGIAGDMLEKKT
ncbi:MAG: Type I Iterative PKS [Chrysothrix sp. TS-e1954]|nr:MAG: Type I Iterative PKS [Chrysothrix sp. TS-e1954]